MEDVMRSLLRPTLAGVAALLLLSSLSGCIVVGRGHHHDYLAEAPGWQSDQGVGDQGPADWHNGGSWQGNGGGSNHRHH
jgi:hypothetical protein